MVGHSRGNGGHVSTTAAGPGTSCPLNRHDGRHGVSLEADQPIRPLVRISVPDGGFQLWRTGKMVLDWAATARQSEHQSRPAPVSV